MTRSSDNWRTRPGSFDTLHAAHIFPTSSALSQWMVASLTAGNLVDPMDLPRKPPKVTDKQQIARQAKEIEQLTTQNELLRRENEKLRKELSDERHAREAADRRIAFLELKDEKPPL